MSGGESGEGGDGKARATASEFGMVMREAHYPGRAPVDTYGNGGFRFAEMSHRGSILCLPSGIYGWSAEQPADLTAANFKRVLSEEGLELLLVGASLEILIFSGRSATQTLVPSCIDRPWSR